MSFRFANGWDPATARSAMLLDPTVTNLNTGSFGPLPRAVFEFATSLRHRLAEEPMDFLVRRLPELLWPARQRLAHFLGADPHRLIFTQNVTASVNIVASGLVLAGPGEILLTDHEYGAMHWCWERAAQRQGLTIRTFALPILASDPQEVIDACRAAMTPRTRLLFFSHVLSPTGMVLPARELCAEARRRGVITVVDGAHAPAMVTLDLDAIGADFYGANCHKWLLAPTGAGFLYLGKGSEDRLAPLQVSWGWRPDRTRLDDRDEFGSTPRLRYLEFEGTRDICPWLAVPAAIDFQTALDFSLIRLHNAQLVRHAHERLSQLPGLRRATPLHPDLHGFMTAYRLPAEIDPVDWRRELWQRYRIEVPIIERAEGPRASDGSARSEAFLAWAKLIRVSTHFYNTAEQIDVLVEALKVLVPVRRR